MNKTSKAKFNILFPFVVATALVIGYLLGINNSHNMPQPSSVESSPYTDFNALFYPTSVNSKPNDFKIYRPRAFNLEIKYPAGWNITEHDSSVEATSLYFDVSSDSKGIAHTRKVVDCWESEELGLCYEGSTLSELDFFISKIEPEDIKKPESEVCGEKYVEEKLNKIIYSCLTSGFAGEPVHRYMVYFEKDNEHYRATFQTGDPYITRELIRYIDSSF